MGEFLLLQYQFLLLLTHNLFCCRFGQLAAQRFVRYWESRLQLFGPDKFHLRMTLSEAARDHVVAIKAGMVSILPHPDLSGRPLCVIEPPRNTGKGYTAESMVRTLCRCCRG